MKAKLKYSGDIKKDIYSLRNVTDKEIDQHGIEYNPKNLSELEAFFDFYGNDIVIFGDCDADGLSAINVVKAYFPELRYNYSLRTDRGFTVESVKRTLQKFPDTQAILTVDCGINSVEAVNYARSQGVRVLITDHHNPEEFLPKCTIINPKVNNSGFDGLCGAGVIYACLERLYGINDIAVQYAAIGTIADVVPVLCDSRHITKMGLYSIYDLGNDFITAAGIKIKNVDETLVGWTIAPLINSGSRMGFEDIAARAYVDKDQEAIALLSQYNSDRKLIVDEVMSGGELTINETDNSVSLLVQSEIAGGIMGLIGSKLNSQYKKPSIALMQNGDHVVASMRGYGSGSFVNHIKEKYENSSGGGHDFAAGFKVESAAQTIQADYHSFYENIQVIEEEYRPDIEMKLSQAQEAWQQMYQLRPFGHMFEEPTFMLDKVKCQHTGTTKSGNNKYTIKQGRQTIICYDYNNMIDDPEKVTGVAVRLNQYPYAKELTCILQKAKGEK